MFVGVEIGLNVASLTSWILENGNIRIAENRNTQIGLIGLKT